MSSHVANQATRCGERVVTTLKRAGVRPLTNVSVRVAGKMTRAREHFVTALKHAGKAVFHLCECACDASGHMMLQPRFHSLEISAHLATEVG